MHETLTLIIIFEAMAKTKGFHLTTHPTTSSLTSFGDGSGQVLVEFYFDKGDETTFGDCPVTENESKELIFLSSHEANISFKY